MTDTAHTWVEDDDNEVAERQPVKRRLARAVKPFIRIPAEWIKNPAFNDRTRLLLLLIQETREGNRTAPVALTSAFAAKAGVSPYSKNRCLRHLQKAGLINIDWRNRRAPLITVPAIDL
jgi:hypothetical protein